MSYKEKREFEELEKEIAQLEEEKKSLETLLCSGTLSNDDMLKKSNRIGEIIELLDMKELRWLELSELN
jgi:ATP-binding cassette subfamily F protein uup